MITTKGKGVNLMFSTRHLENWMRSWVTTHHTQEIGGWFLTRWEPGQWAPGLSRELVYTLSDSEYRPRFIEQVLLAPNRAENTNREYRPYDWAEAQAMAEQTAIMMGGVAIQFHTHPGGNLEPSQADIAIAAKYDELWVGHAEFIIVGAYPFALRYYMMEYSRQSRAKSYKLDYGQLVSWRRKALRGIG